MVCLIRRKSPKIDLEVIIVGRLWWKIFPRLLEQLFQRISECLALMNRPVDGQRKENPGLPFSRAFAACEEMLYRTRSPQLRIKEDFAAMQFP
jgi:hypothetical protein